MGLLDASAVTAWGLTSILPLSATWNLSVAVTLADIPVAVTFAASETGMDVPTHLRALLRWKRHARLHLPGGDPTCPPSGYRLLAD